MKKILMTLIILGSVQATATWENKFICKQTNDEAGAERVTMVLTQAFKGGMDVEDQDYPYDLELYTSASRAPFLKRRVQAQENDVLLTFKDKAGEVTGRIYQDELDQTSITLNGKEIEMDCN